MQFEKFRQNPETHLINQITNSAFAAANDYYDDKAYTLDIQGKMTARITDPDIWTGTTARFFDVMALQYTRNRRVGNIIQMTLEEYMDLLDLKSEAMARQQIYADMRALGAIQLEFKEQRGKRSIRRGFFNISSAKRYIESDVIYFPLSPELCDMLENECYSMDLNTDAFKINARQYPDAYFISRFLDLNYRLNKNKISLEYVYISTILAHCKSIPGPEKAGKKKREKIINPFFKTLDAVGISYELMDKKENRLDKAKISYAEFISAKVKFDYKDHKRLLGGRDCEPVPCDCEPVPCDCETVPYDCETVPYDCETVPYDCEPVPPFSEPLQSQGLRV